MELQVRRVEPADLADVRRIVTAYPQLDYDLDALAGGDESSHIALVAVSSGHVAGWIASRPDVPVQHVESRLRLAMAVAPDLRRRGIGGRLLRALEGEVEARGVRQLRWRLDDGNEAALAFLKAQRYVEDHRIGYFVLDLEKRAPARDASTEARIGAAGVVISGYARDDLDEALTTSLVALYAEAAVSAPDYNSGRSMTEGAAGYRRSLEPVNELSVCVFVARRGDEIVGASNFRLAGRRSDRLTQGYTMVAPAFRSQGIAQALKARTIDFAREQGLRSIRTKVDLTNTPMLRVNERFGFKLKSSDVLLLKRLDSDPLSHPAREG